MQLLIGSPLGYWALVGVPILLLIHALQQRTTRTDCSTLFLLEDLAPESVRGPVLDALRPSWLLLLQLLAVALLVWLLLDPRWIAADSKRVVAFVVDGSVSMSSFKDEAIAAVRTKASQELTQPGTVDWALIDTRRSGQVLYRGSDLGKMESALRHWEPSGGYHDYQPALHYALEIAGREGLAIFVTDHMVAVPPASALLAVGRPIENCGFAGATVEGESFSAVVRNYGREGCERTLRAGDREERLSLAPGELKTLRGSIPPGSAPVELRLEGDGFPIDDAITIVRPERKLLRVAAPRDVGPVKAWWDRIAKTVERVAETQGEAELVVGGSALLESRGGDAIVFADGVRKDARLGRVFAEHHPLVDHLPWDDLRAVSMGDTDLKEGDEPLVWSGEHPLIFLRPAVHGQRLVINLRPENSNLSRNSSFILLIHRFIERVRSRAPGSERMLVETNQRLPLVTGSELVSVVERSLDGSIERSRTISPAAAVAPSIPGAFAVNDAAGVELLSGAAYFAEVVEADLRDAAKFDGTDGRSARGSTQQSKYDPFTSLWLLLLLTLLLAAWRTAAQQEVV